MTAESRAEAPRMVPIRAYITQPTIRIGEPAWTRTRIWRLGTPKVALPSPAHVSNMRYLSGRSMKVLGNHALRLTSW